MYPQSQQLFGYIDGQLAHGVAAAQIRNNLLSTGWPLPIVDDSLNQELAHTAHILPAPIDLNAYYSYNAPQYYYPGFQLQPAIAGADTDTGQIAAKTARPILVVGYGLWRFILSSLLVLLVVWGPAILAVGWLLVVALAAGSTGINVLGSYIIVCTLGWIAVSSLRYSLAPFIAAAHLNISIRQTLSASRQQIYRYIHGEGKEEG